MCDRAELPVACGTALNRNGKGLRKHDERNEGKFGRLQVSQRATLITCAC